MNISKKPSIFSPEKPSIFRYLLGTATTLNKFMNDKEGGIVKIVGN
jgi:hypothetical protein